jgi:hypothetical protein
VAATAQIAGLIFGCDVVLNTFISENLDDEVKQSVKNLAKETAFPA